MSFDRSHRCDVFRLVGVTLSAEALLRGGWPAAYTSRFFSPAEYPTVTELCSLLLPADEVSPGAKEAGVPWFLDTVLYYADAGRQQVWRKGLATVHAAIPSSEQLTVVLSAMAENEGDPQTPLQYFFAELNATIIKAFALCGLASIFRLSG